MGAKSSVYIFVYSLSLSLSLSPAYGGGLCIGLSWVAMGWVDRPMVVRLVGCCGGWVGGLPWVG